MTRWWAHRLGWLAVVLALAPFSGVRARGGAGRAISAVLQRCAAADHYETGSTCLRAAGERVGAIQTAPPGRCYTPTTNCPLSDQRLIGHPSS
jgi:hypothetical protein